MELKFLVEKDGGDASDPLVIGTCYGYVYACMIDSSEGYK